MFDMASIKKLKELNLCFVPDLSIPNFSEALSKFINLHSLRISQINWSTRINSQLLLKFIQEGASSLRNLSLDQIQFTDDQFRLVLFAIQKSKSLRGLVLSSIHLDSDFKVELMTGFIGSNSTHLTKLSLVENQIATLDHLFSQIYLNKSLKELHIMKQSFFRAESKISELDVFP